MRGGLDEERRTVEPVWAVERAVGPFLANAPVEDACPPVDQVLVVIADAGDDGVDRVALLLDQPMVLLMCSHPLFSGP